MEELKFGTSGLRGLVTQLRPEVCAGYVRAFLRHMEETGNADARTILVGYDLRDSSPSIARACLTAAAAEGYAAVDCGELPTPALALEALRRKVPAIMVTGSHIPADRNGLKFYRPDGEVTKTDELGILEWLGKDRPSAAAGSISSDAGVRQAYLERYLAVHGFSLEGLAIGVYQHSSVSRDIIVELIEGLGGTAVPLGRSDVFVPVDTEALRPEDVGLARKWASEQRLDAIVSTDGDADRPLVADEAGEFLRGDVVGILTASRLGAAAVVTPVTSSSAVEASGLFERTIRTRVGSPYVIEGMCELSSEGGVVVGFEANGGVLLGTPVNSDDLKLSPLPTRDAVLPILGVLSAARRRGLPVSGLVKELPAYFTASDRLKNVPATASASFLDMISDQTRLTGFLDGFVQATGVDRTDGVRLQLASDETLHFRASGNAPELRCYAEGSSPERASELLQWGLRNATLTIRTS